MATNENTILYSCADCGVECKRNCDFQRHVATAKHIRNTTTPMQHDCSYCDYSTMLTSDWNKHLNTKKHVNREAGLCKSIVCDVCDTRCRSVRAHRIHKQTCEQNNVMPIPTPPYADIITKLIEENKEMRSFLVEEFRKIASEQKNVSGMKQTNHIHNGTVNNKSFNINFFLNEQCKNASNLSDFVKQIQVTREDLENNAHLGFVSGISKIFLDNLKQLDIYERPIHCTDVKREIIYVRDDDKWCREEDDSKLRSAIQEISRKSVGTLICWKKENVDYADGDSEFSQLCIPMLRNSIAGDDRDVFFPKVVRTVIKELTIKG